jgi:hypothetical protein
MDPYRQSVEGTSATLYGAFAVGISAIRGDVRQ